MPKRVPKAGKRRQEAQVKACKMDKDSPKDKVSIWKGKQRAPLRRFLSKAFIRTARSFDRQRFLNTAANLYDHGRPS